MVESIDLGQQPPESAGVRIKTDVVRGPAVRRQLATENLAVGGMVARASAYKTLLRVP